MTCTHNRTEYRSIHGDSCCSCHINPPCSYCTDQELHCLDCGEVTEEYEPYSSLTSGVQEVWKPKPFTPEPCGNGFITGYGYDGRSGSTMVFKGAYTGEVTNEDLLKYFGTGTFGHRFGSCSGGHFTFTKITD